MNLATTIDIHAGGPGSGCVGPNCGRPSKGRANEVANLSREIKELKSRLKRGSGATTKDRKRIRMVIKIFQNHIRQLGRQESRPSPSTPKINPAPVRKSVIVQQHTLANGAKYTIVTGSKAGRPMGSGNAAKNPNKVLSQAHKEKGQFQATHTDITPTGQDARVSVYDTSKQGTEGAGSTVIVNRDFGKNRVVVQEMSRGQYGHLDALLKQFKFKNFGQAAGMLNKRYGIRQALPKKG
jgi:hypothetical protein